jgi:iron(III) transport system substrate-binding protein
MLTRRQLLLSTALAPLALPAARAAAQASDDWKRVLDAARKEGKVVMYSGAVGNPMSPKIATAFEAKYGLRLELLEARASELRERIRTEQASGKVLGDVSHNGSTTTQLQLNEGVFQPYGALPNAGRPVAPFKSDGTRVPIYVISYGILVNTEMVKPADEPRSWQDVLAPRWKGQILADDMRALGGGAVFFMVTYQNLGREYHDKLAAQKPHMNRELRGNYRRVARGEYPLYLPFTLPDILDLRDLPVKHIVPAEGVPYVRFDGAIFKNAPHPNAARLLMDFFLSDDVQGIYAASGFRPVVGGVEGKAPAEARPLVTAKLFGTTDPKLQDEMLKTAAQIYK